MKRRSFVSIAVGGLLVPFSSLLPSRTMVTVTAAEFWKKAAEPDRKPFRAGFHARNLAAGRCGPEAEAEETLDGSF